MKRFSDSGGDVVAKGGLDPCNGTGLTGLDCYTCNCLSGRLYFAYCFPYFRGKAEGVLNMELLARCTKERLLAKQHLEFRDLSEIYQCLYDTHKQRHQTRLVDNTLFI